MGSFFHFENHSHGPIRESIALTSLLWGFLRQQAPEVPKGMKIVCRRDKLG
jgi:hypothetical protein